MTKQQAILLLFVLIIIGGGATYYVTQSKQQTPSIQPQTETQTSTTNTSPTNTTQASSNTAPTTTTGSPSGTTATASSKKLTDKVSYDVPEGDIEWLTVNVTVDASGKITDVTFAFDTPTNHDSRHYQNSFSSAFNASSLVGTKLSDAKISRTGGASLSTTAFNRALSDLATKANG